MADTYTIEVMEDQCLMDLAMQEYGTPEGVSMFLEDNPGLTGISDFLEPGLVLLCRKEPEVADKALMKLVRGKGMKFKWGEPGDDGYAVFAWTLPNGYILKSDYANESFLQSTTIEGVLCLAIASNGHLMAGLESGRIFNATTNQYTNFEMDGMVVGMTNAKGSRQYCILYNEIDNESFVYTTIDGWATVGLACPVLIGKIYKILVTNDDLWCTFSDIGIGNGNAINIVQEGDFMIADYDARNNHMYAYDGNMVYKSGANDFDVWEPIAEELDLKLLRVLSTGRILFTDSDGQVYYTDNEFVSWNLVSGDQRIDVDIVELNGVLFGADIYGNINKSVDFGLSWVGVDGNPQMGETSIEYLIARQ